MSFIPFLSQPYSAVFFYSFSSFNGAIFLLPQVPGLLNVDFADVRAIMKRCRLFLFWEL